MCQRLFQQRFQLFSSHVHNNFVCVGMRMSFWNFPSVQDCLKYVHCAVDMHTPKLTPKVLGEVARHKIWTMSKSRRILPKSTHLGFTPSQIGVGLLSYDWNDDYNIDPWLKLAFFLVHLEVPRAMTAVTILIAWGAILFLYHRSITSTYSATKDSTLIRNLVDFINISLQKLTNSHANT